MDVLVKHSTENIFKMYSSEILKAIVSFIYKRLCALDKYDPFSLPPLRTSITLLTPTVPAIEVTDPTYGLQKVTYI